jgi:hypothetical protein
VPWLLIAQAAAGADESAAAAQAAPAADRPGPRGLGERGQLLRLSVDLTAAENAARYLLLRGPDARRQLVVSGEYSSGQLHDLTREVRYEASPEGIVRVDAEGLVFPLADGEAAISVRGPGDAAASLTLKVERFAEPPAVNFPNQIVPIFTKLGCNSGGCHGKSGGQNGFSLSLLGFYPDDDYEYLVKEAFARRIFPAAPEHSLLLQKASGAVAHGGGQRTEPGSFEYRRIVRWLEQGLPYGNPEDPVVARIEVFPRQRLMNPGARQQLTVFAYYSDGFVENVTPLAQFEANLSEMAEVSASGLVGAKDLAGDVAIMVRYQGQVDVFRATVPLGVEVKELPPARNFIDELVFGKLKLLGLPASKLCDDATFIRRVTVDICGRMPRLEETREFLASQDPEKRQRLIDRLLASTDYADFFANKWSAVLRNKRDNDQYTRGTIAFHDWIRESLHRNKPYDQFVREVIAASGELSQHPPVVWYRAVRDKEERVEDAAQLFLGLRIKCARCHHHPFEKWSQKDYYGFSAFFSQVATKKPRDGANSEQRVVHRPGKASDRNPRSGETLRPTGLGDHPLDLRAEDDPRLALASWMADPQNPFFAPALANRYWKHFFNRGLVEPEDDMRETNPAANPELLHALAQHFIKSGFDLKALVRSICDSSTYQLASEPNEWNENDKQNFSRYYPRRLNAEVLYDSVHVLAGTPQSFGGLPEGTRAVQLPDTGVNNYFLTVFGRPMASSSCECERSSEANLAQSLHLINSKELQDKLASGSGRAAQLAKDEARKPEEKLHELYLIAYARPPVADELQVALAYLEKAQNKQQAYEDILWALMNTKEFLFNH